MAAGNIHLLIFILSLNPPTLFGNIQINPKERSDTLQSDLDFDLEEGLLESEHKDETKKILADSLVLQQPGLEELEFDPGPFQLLPAKVNFFIQKIKLEFQKKNVPRRPEKIPRDDCRRPLLQPAHQVRPLHDSREFVIKLKILETRICVCRLLLWYQQLCQFLKLKYLEFEIIGK